MGFSQHKPAFPCVRWVPIASQILQEQMQAGMSYREWLIGQALSGYCADPNLDSDQAAKASVAVADMVLAALDRELVRQVQGEARQLPTPDSIVEGPMNRD